MQGCGYQIRGRHGLNAPHKVLLPSVVGKWPPRVAASVILARVQFASQGRSIIGE